MTFVKTPAYNIECHFIIYLLKLFVLYFTVKGTLAFRKMFVFGVYKNAFNKIDRNFNCNVHDQTKKVVS